MNPLSDGKPVAGFPAYRVTPDGNIWSLYVRGSRRLAPEWRLMKFGARTQNYKAKYRRVILLDAHGVRHPENVHVLILRTFIGTCPDGLEACHNNGNSLDNRLENLRWDTRAANQADRKEHGTAISGSKHYLWRSGVKIGTFKSKEHLNELRNQEVL